MRPFIHIHTSTTLTFNRCAYFCAHFWMTVYVTPQNATTDALNPLIEVLDLHEHTR